MQLKLLPFALTLICVSNLVLASEDRSSKDISLALAVEGFNLRNDQQREQAGQLPLTEEEVVAAVRSWQPGEKPKVSNDLRNRVRAIAETRVMPPGALLGRVAVHYQSGYRFEVYRIMLNVVGSETELPANVVVRNHFISSRKIRPEEQRELDESLAAIKSTADDSKQ
ncbi:hypothetical protein [Novipirellula sp.]|uniref:hypothetical protein n=1 Tax=Novipirellula sp. TaxID=2795430 RepID=UPI0035685C17